MAFFGFQRPAPDDTDSLRRQAWQELRREGDLPMLALNFGLNLMANSETQGLGQAMGGAGLNALGDYKSIMAARQKAAQAEQARQDKLAQEKIQNEMAEKRYGLDERRLGWDMKHGDLQDRIALATLQGTQQSNALSAYKTLTEIQSRNAAREAMGLPPLPMPQIPGMPSLGATGATGGSAQGGVRMFSDLKLNEANNNPGNIRGKTGVGNGYAGYDTTLDGFRALDGLLQRGYRGMTPEQFVHKYAPSSDGNDEAAYAAVIRKAGVVGPDGIIHVEDPQTRAALMKVIAGHEGPTSRFDLSEADMAAGLVPIPEGYKSRNLREQSKDWKRPAAEGQKPVAMPTVGWQEQAPASPAAPEQPAQPAASDPIKVGGAVVTPEWLAMRQRVAAQFPDTPEGKAAKQDLEFYKDAVEARRKQTKDDKEGDVKQSDISGLAKEFRSDTSSYSDAQEALSTALEAVRQNSGAGDLALVFSYMKALDPGSVVREGEQLMARKTGGVTDQFLGMIANLQNGQQLTQDVRMGLLRGAKGLVTAREKAYKQRVDYYTGRAKRNGYDPQDIVYNAYPGLMAEVDAFLEGQGASASGSRGGAQPAPLPGVGPAPVRGGAQAAMSGTAPIPALPKGFTIIGGN